MPDAELLREHGAAAGAWLTACALTWALTPVMRSVAVRAGWVAWPARGRWGKRVTARLGGVAMFAGFVGSVLLWVPSPAALAGLLLGVSLVFGLGLLDDLRRMPPYTKLVGQLLIGCVVVFSGIRFDIPHTPWLTIPLSVLWLVLIMNAFNLLDNMDGLAAGIGAIAAGFSAVRALLSGQADLVLLNAILCGICVGFLRFNFPPAKIYMGDSGSHLLGLSLAACSILGTWRHPTQLLSVLAIPSLLLAVPIFDTLFVTIQRLVNRQHPFTGGSDHVSHRLAILGLSDRQTVLALYGLSAGLGALSVATLVLRPLSTLAIWLFVVAMLLLIGRYLAQVNVYRMERAAREGAAEPRQSVTLIETMLHHKRRLLEILVDFAIVSGAYVFAHLLRFEGTLAPDLQQLIIQALPVVLVVKLTCFAACGLYRGVWRYLGLTDLVVVFKAVTLGSVLSLLGLVYLWRFEGYSRAALIIDWMLTLLAVGGARVAGRLLDEWVKGAVAGGTPIVIVGAGDTGARVLRLIRDERPLTRRVVGFLDDDPSKHGTQIHGTPVFGGRGRLAETVRQFQAREVLIAMSDPPGGLLQHVQACCEPRGISWRVVTVSVTSTV